MRCLSKRHCAVAKSKSLFDDPAAEISELSYVITQVQHSPACSELELLRGSPVEDPPL